jgi:2-amino-4-hydroxy-6-hydroxymethyldihydropteridine diphosphokinase
VGSVHAWVGLGSNLGDGRRQFRDALRALHADPAIEVRRASSLYRTAPWGVTDQPEFSNAVAELRTSLAPHALLDRLLAAERAAGRVRDGARWGPRTLDLDLLVYDDAVIDTPTLRVPHPHAHERDFVLVPLAELAPELELAGHGTVASCLDGRDAKGVSRAPGTLWP